MTLEAGQTLGPYQVQSAIGQGGMGEVYRAHDTKLGRDVAIKGLPAELAEDADRLGRFRREAQVLASLNHPGIAAIHGLEEVDGSPFLVLELVEGEDLSERLSRGPIPLDEALDIARQVAEALEEAHGKGIVHRDLKPPNIRITPDGSVKVLDFGLAKAYTGDTGEGAASDLSQSPTMAKTGTQAGMILGTAAYMSPEQARGRALDKRTDIWAFGVVVYEMLTGRAMFSEETLSDTLAAILKSEPDWKPLPAGLPQPVRRLLKRCLTKKPKDRLHDIADARLDIEEALAGPTESETVVHATEPSRLAWLAAAVFFLTSAALAALYFGRAPAPAGLMTADIAPPRGTRFSLNPVHPGFPAISPDGTMIVFTVVEPSGVHRLHLRSLVEPRSRPLDGTENAAYPFWSPDSRIIGFFAGQKLRTVAASDSALEILSDALVGKGGSWNRDGVIVFAPSSLGPLYRVSAQGGEPVPVTELDPSSEHNSHRHPRFLPDGQHFLYYARSKSGDENSAIFVGSLDGAEPKLLMRSDNSVLYNHGHLLFARSGKLMAQPFSAERHAFDGDAVEIAEDVSPIRATGRAPTSVSESGSLIFQGYAEADPLTRLELLDADGSRQRVLGEDDNYRTAQEYASAFSPDGRQAAVVILDPESGTNDIWIFDLARETRTRFTFDPSEDLSPVWSPDGSRLAFQSSRGGNQYAQIYAKDIAGTEAPELLFQADGFFTEPSDWSADGAFLAARGLSPTTGNDIWIVPADGSGEAYPFLQTRFNETGTFSPDGRFMAVESDESGQDEIYIVSFPSPGRKWRVSSNGGTSPRWRSDGRALYYRESSGWVVSVDVDTRGPEVDIGEIRRLFEVSGLYVRGTAWWPSPDGSQFLVARPQEEEARPLTLIVNWTAMLQTP